MFKCRDCGRYFVRQENKCFWCSGVILDEEAADRYIQRKKSEQNDVYQESSMGQEVIREEDLYVEQDVYKEDISEEDDEDSDYDEYEDEDDEESWEREYHTYEQKKGSQPIPSHKKKIKNFINGIVVLMFVWGMFGEWIDDAWLQKKQNVQLSKEEMQALVQETMKQEETGILLESKVGERSEGPEVYIEEEELRNVLEAFFHKPIGSITWDDIDSIQSMTIKKYNRDTAQPWRLSISQYTPQSLPEGQKYEDTLKTYSLSQDLELYGDIALFHGVKMLDVTQYYDIPLSHLEGMKEVETLCIGSVGGLESVSDLQGFTNLKKLELHNGRLETLEGIESLVGLQKLVLVDNKSKDLTPLTKLVNLEDLSIHDHEVVVDIRVIAGMTQLKKLSLEGETIVDVSSLEALQQLTDFRLVDTAVADVNFLEKLPNLVTLESKSNDALKSLQVVRVMPTLRHFKVREYGIDIPVLEQITSFEASGLANVDAMRYMPQLEELTLHAVTLDDMGALTKLPKLVSLTIDNSESSSCSEEAIDDLFRLPALKSLTLKGGEYQLNSLESLSQSQIEKLHLDKAQMVDQMTIQRDGYISNIDYDAYENDEVFQALTTIPTLQELTFTNLKLRSLEGVQNLEQLKVLNVADNQIGDMNPLKGNTKLQTLHISNNPLTDMTAISELPALEQLWIEEVDLLDEGVIEELRQVCAIVQ